VYEHILKAQDNELRLFPYDANSIMNYGIPMELTNSLTNPTNPCGLKGISPTNELSDGDKRKIAAMYPKPSGGYVDMILDDSRQQISVDFRRYQLSPPRVVLGLNSFLWDPHASANATLMLTKTHIEGDAFFFGAAQGRGSFQGKLTGSYVAIDPLIKDICVAAEDFSVLRDENQENQENKQDGVIELPSRLKRHNAVIWIKNLRVKRCSNSYL
jgi:hypothetical protein